MRLIKMGLLCLAAAAITATVSSCAPPNPAAQSPTLERILDRGTIRIACYIDAPPMGYVDAEGKPAGYDVELAHRLAEALGVELELQQVTAANRMPYLVTKKVDLVIAGTSATYERARQVMFSAPYANSYIGVFGPKTVAVTGAAGLGNLRIAVPRGSIQEGALMNMVPEKNLMRVDTDAAATTALFTGQAELMATNNIVMKSLMDQNPSRNLEIKFQVLRNSQHMVVRQGDFEVLQFVNTFIFLEKLSGRLDELHKKWIGEPLGELPY